MFSSKEQSSPASDLYIGSSYIHMYMYIRMATITFSWWLSFDPAAIRASTVSELTSLRRA